MVGSEVVRSRLYLEWVFELPPIKFFSKVLSDISRMGVVLCHEVHNAFTEHSALLFIIARRSFLNVSQYLIAFMGSPLDRNSTSRIPCLSQNTVHIIFCAENFVLNFLLLGIVSALDCCFDSIQSDAKNSSFITGNDFVLTT